ncbi:putative protein FAM90A22P [Camelus ferus]|uniref:Zinc knuckle domain-containing protein n=1 Tax=Camelus ferus TaxID=419612 RepID=A0A8B8S3H8_CAMFR|nr:putative protein FAM90A22P [Camelus ferus]
MASRHTQRGPCTPFQAQKVKKYQPVQETPPPPQGEDCRVSGSLHLRGGREGAASRDRVKCKDCGAFGHRASSLRCPMKRWQGAQAPQPLGSTRGKENLEPRKLQGLWTPRTSSTAAREEGQRPRQEQQRKPLQRFPRGPQPQQRGKEASEPYGCVGCPNTPMLIKTSWRKSVLEPDRASRSPIRKDDMNSTCLSVFPIKRGLVQDSKSSIKMLGEKSAQISIQACLNPPKKPRLSLVQIPQRSTLRLDLGVFQNLHSPPSTTEQGPTGSPQVNRKTPAQGQSTDLQSQANRSPPNTVQACSVPRLPPINHVPSYPLRMVFIRLSKGGWSCRYMTSPSFHPAEKPSPPGQSPPICRKSEGRYAPGSLSVLYDDLQVSSSSEDSDWE